MCAKVTQVAYCFLCFYSSFSCVNLDEQNKSFNKENKSPQKFYSASAPASTNSLLGSFEVNSTHSKIYEQYNHSDFLVSWTDMNLQKGLTAVVLVSYYLNKPYPCCNYFSFVSKILGLQRVSFGREMTKIAPFRGNCPPEDSRTIINGIGVVLTNNTF